MSIRASLKQLIISVIVTIHQNSHVLNWSQIKSNCYLYRSAEMLLESTTFSSTSSKKLAHRFLNISCSGWQGGQQLFLFGKFKACVKTYVDFKLKKICRQKLLNIYKTYDFVIKPLKI